MSPADVPEDLVSVAVDAIHRQVRYHSIEADVRASLAAVLPLHEQQVRERLGLHVEWDYRCSGGLGCGGAHEKGYASEREARVAAHEGAEIGYRYVTGWETSDA